MRCRHRTVNFSTLPRPPPPALQWTALARALLHPTRTLRSDPRMSVNLDKMLERCRREQWSVDDFDWTGTPIALSPDREREICAYYVNMSYIERLAGALFLALAKRVDDP